MKCRGGCCRHISCFSASHYLALGACRVYDLRHENRAIFLPNAELIVGSMKIRILKFTGHRPAHRARPRAGGRARIRDGISTAIVAVAVFVLAGVPVGPANAQDSNLTRQIERLRRDLNDLQRYVYREQKPPKGEAGAEQLSPAVAARMQLQLSQIQEQVRAMNGKVEEVQHRISVVEQRLQRMSEDLEIRLQEMEDRIGGGAPVQPATRPGAGEGAVADALAALPANASPRDQYDFAFDLLKKRDYNAAAGAFQAFLDRNGKDPLAGNALYWLGETRYVQKQYGEAAKIFLDGYKRFPDGTKAPDNLLKLGMSLAALEKAADACKTFARMLSEFPKAPSRLRRAAENEQKRLECR